MLLQKIKTMHNACAKLSTKKYFINRKKVKTKRHFVFIRIVLSSPSVINKRMISSPQIFWLQELIELSFCGNSLTELQPDIKNMTKLKALDLSHNRLTDLPHELMDLSQIEVLGKCLQKNKSQSTSRL